MNYSKPTKIWDLEMLTDNGWVFIDHRSSKQQAIASKNLYQLEHPNSQFRVKSRKLVKNDSSTS